MGCSKLQVLNMKGLTKAVGPGLAAVGENCHSITDLNLANCVPLKEWVMLRVFNGMPLLEVLDLSNCFGVTDTSMKQLANTTWRGKTRSKRSRAALEELIHPLAR